MRISVNGTVIVPEMSFPPTGAWTTWQAKSVQAVTLRAGPNVVKATSLTAAGGPNADYLEVTS